MLTEVGSSALDREARNEYLCELDEAWELCKQDIEQVRSSYEEALDSARHAYDARLEEASVAHGEAISEAWTNYRNEVNGSTAADRRELIAEARVRYQSTVTTIRKSYRKSTADARVGYAAALRTARMSYEEAIDSAYGSHREAIEMVHHYLELTEDDGDEMDLTPALEEPAPAPSEVVAEDKAEDSRPTHPSGGDKEIDEAGFVDWLAGTGLESVSNGAAA
jgi:hypothetical protein